MILLDGKATAQAIRSELKANITAQLKTGCRRPGLSVILVGDNPASQLYVKYKTKACQEVGIAAETIHLPADVKETELLKTISSLNTRSDVDGILLQLPLPTHLDPVPCLTLIDPSKDVDGFHPENAGRLSLGLPCLKACTPQGIMELLHRYNLSPKGKKAVVVGRSNIVGKPLALLLAQPLEYANATVTLCHSQSANLMAECRAAEFLFCAVGRPKFFTKDYVSDGCVVIDVGINHTKAGLCGDCDFEDLKDKVSAISPVPGGVGPMTIAMLLKNTIQAWTNHLMK